MFGGSAYWFAIIKYFSFAFFPFIPYPFATQLFFTPLTSSNLRNQALLLMELCVFTGHLFKFQDPQTGVSIATAFFSLSAHFCVGSIFAELLAFAKVTASFTLVYHVQPKCIAFGPKVKPFSCLMRTTRHMERCKCIVLGKLKFSPS